MAAGALVLLSPLMIAIALAVKLTSRGPVIHAQDRVGIRGRPFKFYKFRSMRVDADASAHQDYVRALINGEAETEDPVSVEGEDVQVFKLVDDPRVTGVGRLLRRYSLDELPQLWNVLVGDMSLVGPRPPLPYEVEAYQPWHHRPSGGQPGITGVWQVEGRSRVSFDEMVFQDILYAAHATLWWTSRCACAPCRRPCWATEPRERQAARPGDSMTTVAIVGHRLLGPQPAAQLHGTAAILVKWVCDLGPEALDKVRRRYPSQATTSELRRGARDPGSGRRRDRHADLHALRTRQCGAARPASTCSSRSR